jgi:hypothetical protein
LTTHHIIPIVGQLYNFNGNGEVKRDQVGETAYVVWNLTGKVGVGEVETGEIGQSLKPGGRKFRQIEIVPGKVEVPEGG